MDSVYIYICAANCKYEIGFNDFVVFQDKTGLNFQCEEPLNHLINKQELLMRVEAQPVNQKKLLTEEVRFECKVKLKNDVLKTENVLFDYEFNEHAKKPPEINFTNLISIPIQTFNSSWNMGEKLQLDKNTLVELGEAYEEFWHALKDGNLNVLSELIRIKELNYATCYGIEYSERLQMALSIYRSHITDSGYVLYEFEPEYFLPKLQCFGKILSLEDGDGFHPVFFLKKDMTGSINMPTYYARIDNKLRIVL